jgi:hypothetical protein
MLAAATVQDSTFRKPWKVAGHPGRKSFGDAIHRQKD